MTSLTGRAAPASVLSKRSAVGIGYSYRQIRYRLQKGEWVRLARGQYAPVEGVHADRFALERAEHVQRAIAAHRNRPGSVISHRSAALFHGLPLISGAPSEVEVNRYESGWDGHDKGVHVHDVRLDPAHIDVIDGVRVTSVARTFFDVAARGTLSDALAVGDAALRQRSDLRLPMFVGSLPKGLRGIRVARLAARHASGVRESPLESWSFARIIEWGLSLPVCQVEFRDDFGTLTARADFVWKRNDGRLLIGECDGALKYQSPDDVYLEKRREDWLRSRGHAVLRWGWEDLRGGGESLRRRLRDALAES